MKRPLLLAWTVLIGMHLVAFLYQYSQGHIYTADSPEYLAEADNIASEGEFYCRPLGQYHDPAFYTKRPPVYPIFILFIRQLSASPYAVLLIQNLLSLFNFYLLFRFLAGLPQVKWVSTKGLWVLILLTPAQAIYANLIMSEILFQCFLLIMVISLLHYIHTRRLSSGLFFALALVLAMLTKPSPYLLAPLLLPAGIWLGWKWRSWKPLALAIIPLAAMLLYMNWNQARTGKFHFSSIEDINLFEYNTYYLLVTQKGEASAQKFTDSVKLASTGLGGYADSLKVQRTACYRYIRDNLLAYSRLHLKGCLNQFLDPGRFDLYTFFGLQQQNQTGLLHAFSSGGYKGVWQYLMGQPIALLLLLGLVTVGQILKTLLFGIFLFRKSIPLYIRIIFALPVIYLAMSTGPLGASRFALPALTMLLAACTMSGWANIRLIRK